MSSSSNVTIVRPVPVRATAPYRPRPSRVAPYARFMTPPSAPSRRELESPLVRSMVYNMAPSGTFGVPLAPEAVNLALSPLPRSKRSAMEIAAEQWEQVPGLKRLREAEEQATRQGEDMATVVEAAGNEAVVRRRLAKRARMEQEGNERMEQARAKAAWIDRKARRLSVSASVSADL